MNNVIQVPLLVHGKIIDAPNVEHAALERAFEPGATYARIGNAQVLRHAEFDRKTMRATGRWIYRVMPVIDPTQLIVRDFEELYAMPYERVFEWLRGVRAALDVASIRESELATSEHPDAFVDAALAAFPLLFDEAHAAAAIDAEVTRAMLDGWVELPHAQHSGPAHLIGGWQPPARKPKLRAFPTRQLHITAGNSPLIPLFSLLRAVWTKSPATIKLPSGAVLPGSMIAMAAARALPDHPITKHLSMVYWPGGEEVTERILLAPTAFDRIVVWGDPESVASVRARAGLTKTLSFNPRYGVSFVGRGVDFEEAAERAVYDTMIENQKACIASLVHYVEGDVADAERYAQCVRRALAKWDAHAHPLLDRHRGQLKRLSRGLLMDAQVMLDPQSTVVIAPHDFAIKEHPACRLVVVRPVASLEACLQFLHAGVATVGVAPEARRLELRDRIAARGVSNIVPLGESGCAAIGAAHDGMMVLSELVEWKNG